MGERLYKKLRFPFLILFLGLSAEISYLSAELKAFEEKCSKCHSLKDPNKYSKQEWKYNVQRMAQRAGLTPDEINSIIELNTKK